MLGPNQFVARKTRSDEGLAKRTNDSVQARVRATCTRCFGLRRTFYRSPLVRCRYLRAAALVRVNISSPRPPLSNSSDFGSGVVVGGGGDRTCVTGELGDNAYVRLAAGVADMSPSTYRRGGSNGKKARTGIGCPAKPGCSHMGSRPAVARGAAPDMCCWRLSNDAGARSHSAGHQ